MTRTHAPLAYLPAKVFSIDGDFICEADLLVDSPDHQRLKIVGTVIEDKTALGAMVFTGGKIIVEFNHQRRRADIRAAAPFEEVVFISFCD